MAPLDSQWLSYIFQIWGIQIQTYSVCVKGLSNITLPLSILQAKVQMLDNLLDIEVAYSLLRGGNEDGDKDPIDINYEKLKTDIKVKEIKGNEWLWIQVHVLLIWNKTNHPN